ncbi:xanthine dehydrogenase family protein molybdopterin-binding subunit [Catenovulum maritimum]|uniref:Aldehyde oxidase/xanthine dehydrogenase a/b hammerhead domain-containing protein n=1 Tax=Catenovulum maritimum TaxID=1513271 RepID=A0A0J8JQT6_9ALTE|nr:molybdopterin cofactor-binding domain-containing protein [Catenovulum maritimum]KMT67086.1 hypothetical protein XM47_00405 [Catenovulum maritimum]
MTEQTNEFTIENISRRNFLKVSTIGASAFALQCTIPLSFEAMAEESGTPRLNLFVAIEEDQSITITCHRSEMGQGIRTSIAQVIADELDADWNFVKITQALGDKSYGNQNTDGSKSIRAYFKYLREFGASAKLMLRQAAAQAWNLPLSEISASNHQVMHASGKTLSYGQLAKLAALQPIPSNDTLTLKTPAEFKYIGKGFRSLDIDDMTSGKAIYGQDIAIPNMVYACLKRTPVMGGFIASLDSKKAKQVSGVLDVIEIKGQPFPSLFNPLASVAVIATNTWAALKGVESLDITWGASEYNNYDSTKEANQTTKNISKAKAKQVTKLNPAQLTDEKNLLQVEATYTLPYLAHAPMEPPAATAMIHPDGKCEIWSCVQAPQAVQRHVSKALGIKPEDVIVHVTLLGGAFGRKAQPDFVVEAALLAKLLNKPVKVVWSREDDIQHDYYHAASVMNHSAKVSPSAEIKSWVSKIGFTPIQSLWNIKKNQPANFEIAGIRRNGFSAENLITKVINTPASTRIGWLRSVANIQHGFSIGCFMDEISVASQIDCKALWLKTLDEQANSQKMKRVIEDVTQNANWAARQNLPEGEALGLAAHHSFESEVAVVSHVKVEGKQLKILKVYISADVGTVVNIDRVKAQMEGAVIFGLSIALHNEISFKDGKVEQTNFHDYPILRLHECPEIEVSIIDSQDVPGGVGEPGVPPVAPSVANAIFAATKVRPRELPLSKTYNI